MGMFSELLRSGKVIANNLDTSIIEKIKKSPLYQYSNITRQEGFRNLDKNKIIARKELEKEFNGFSSEEKYRFIKNILMNSFDVKVEEKYAEYFSNGGNGYEIDSEMGNIFVMYAKLRGKE